MGCSKAPSAKQFHEEDDQEKKEISRKLQDEDNSDENLKYDEPKPHSNNYFVETINKLPYKIGESKERFALFQKLNNNKTRGYISCYRLNIKLTNYLELPNIVRKKDPISLCSNLAIQKYRRDQNKVLEWREFRAFLFHLYLFFTFWEKFIKDNDAGVYKINREDFKEALSLIKPYSNDIDENDFNIIDIYKKGEISFDDFCEVIIFKIKVLEDDEDKKELENFK